MPYCSGVRDTTLIEYQLLIIEINFSPMKDTFPDRLSAVFLTRCRGEHFDLRREIRVKVEVILLLALCSQSVRLGDKPLRLTTSNFCSQNKPLLLYSLRNNLSNERMGLSFTNAAGPRQRSHSRVRVPRDSWPYFSVSDSRLPQPGGPGLRIYIPQKQGGPVIPPGTGFPFRRLLRIAGLLWKTKSELLYDWTRSTENSNDLIGNRTREFSGKYLH
jgi:hypothetical protein